jgi:anti-anti-sigma factor
MFGSMTVLAVESRLARESVAEFEQIVTDQVRSGGRWFVLDLAKAAYLDSAGLEHLLWFQEQVEAAGGVVKVAGLKGHCRQIFEMVRFDKRFEIHPTVHEAVRSFR